MGTTWSICKMNMLLHGIPDADIRQEDTIRRPQHKDDKNELKRYDRVLANPPFSQNYIKKDIEYPGRFAVWMPEKGKKADLMFVQHMLAVLKADGKMATIMPHGVLFRGGEEKEARKHFIEHGWHGSGHRPARRTFLRHRHSRLRSGDEQKGRGQSRPCFFHQRRPRIPRGKGAKFSPPRGHLQDRPRLSYHGRRARLRPSRSRERDRRRGLQLQHPPLRGQRPAARAARRARPSARRRADGGGRSARPFLEKLLRIARARIRPSTQWFSVRGLRAGSRRPSSSRGMVKNDPGIAKAHAHFLEMLEAWWQQNLSLIEALAPNNGAKGNVYELRRQLLASIAETFAAQKLLTDHQIRGAFARYMDDLKADLKSVAASGWGPELIPDDDILQSQFPELLAEMEQKRLRLAELTALFAAADEEDYEDSDDSGVLPSDEVKALRAELKEANAQAKLAKKETRPVGVSRRAQRAEQRLAKHKTLEDEARQLKNDLRATEKKEEELVAAAREKIARDEARRVILDRLHRTRANLRRLPPCRPTRLSRRAGKSACEICRNCEGH